MLLVGQYDSPYVRRVAVSLHLLGIPFERGPLSVFGDFDAVRRRNPLGRVPALALDDGEVLVDSTAILDHLDELAGPERALLPRSGAERRRALQVVALATGCSDKAAAMVYERARRAPGKVDGAWLRRLRTQLEGGLAALERLRPSPWFLGGGFGQADVTAATMLAFVRLALPELAAPERLPGLNRHADACEALPAFVATRPGPDEVPGGPTA
jgi:glutathione S-transferase